METRANFAMIGAFTLAVLVAAFGFVFWFAGPSQTTRHTAYQIEFSGSVAGLSRGGAVQFNGLKVGEVTHLAISENDPSRVDVLIEIDKRTPVKTNTRARLEQTGFTGVSYVALIGGTPGAPDLVARSDGKPPVIQAERSEIQNLLENVQNLSTRAGEVLSRLDKALDNENLANLKGTLENAQKVTADLDRLFGNKTVAKVDGILDNTAVFTRNLAQTSRNFDKVIGRLDRTLAALEPKKLRSITTDIAGASHNLARFSGSGLKQYEMLAIDARKTMGTIDHAVKSIERDPSQFLWGPSDPPQTLTPPEPGK